MRRMEIIQRLAGKFSQGNVSAALLSRTSLFIGIGEGFYDLLRKWRKRSCSDFIDLLPKRAAAFTRYLTSKNNCSYKLVMALVFIRGMDNHGRFPLNTLKKRFCNFYLSRKKKGMVVEAENTDVSKIGESEMTIIKNKAFKKPFNSFLSSGFFNLNESGLCLDKNLSSQLGDKIKKDIVIMALLKEIDDYYLKLEPDESF